jgi:hypothetical protein
MRQPFLFILQRKDYLKCVPCISKPTTINNFRTLIKCHYCHSHLRCSRARHVVIANCKKFRVTLYTVILIPSSMKIDQLLQKWKVAHTRTACLLSFVGTHTDSVPTFFRWDTHGQRAYFISLGHTRTACLLSFFGIHTDSMLAVFPLQRKACVSPVSLLPIQFELAMLHRVQNGLHATVDHPLVI